MNIGSTVELNNGVRMPVLGLGVWRIPSGGKAKEAVLNALATGYRLVDTAMMYGNEGDVGAAFRESGLPREQVFITTKLWRAHQGFEPATRAFGRSLKNLGLDYVDLYLIHWPGGGDRIGSWKAMEKLYEDGRCRAIGVSNFTIDHLEELSQKCRLVPSVNQVEFHPFLNQQRLLEYCRDRGIQVEAYSPLTHGRMLRDRRLLELAAKYRKTAAQVLIRWGLQHRLVVIPKSSRLERIQENADVFDFRISKEDMTALDQMNEGRRISWDPTEVL